MDRPTALYAAGSSPHARGAPTVVLSWGALQGTIPAYAGSTRLSRTAVRHRGIIPACAGSTRDNGNLPKLARNHPRIRGEHKQVTGAWARLGGSSPHALGAHILCNLVEPIVGIIPACAGSTPRSGAGRKGGGDHPRMRGEHYASVADRYSSLGSSPHARGALLVPGATEGACGIIPACAGSTSSRAWATPPSGDHPRMRGKHRANLLMSLSVAGSSLHARGAPVQAGELGDATGIISACAGSTRRRGRPRGGRWDHPRMRGEHCAARCLACLMAGSSPHARGAPARWSRMPFHSGIIPACAGSTNTRHPRRRRK